MPRRTVLDGRAPGRFLAADVPLRCAIPRAVARSRDL